MRYYTSEQVGRTFIINLERGDLLRETLSELAKREGIKNAAVLSGIACCDEINMQMTTTYNFPIGFYVEQLKEPLELASLDGTIVNFEPHIHGVVSNSSKTWAGHLLDGCSILYVGEVIIQELLGNELIRKPDENGVNLIKEN